MNIIVILLVAILFAVLYNIETDENFTYVVPTVPSMYCSNCGSMNRRRCGKCANCGFCIASNGVGECVPGDANGPHFRSDCAQWEYAPPEVIVPTYTYPVAYYGNPTYWTPRRPYRRPYDRRRRRH